MQFMRALRTQKQSPVLQKITWIPQNLQPGQTKKIEKHTSLGKKSVWPIHSCWTAKRKEVLWSYECHNINLSFFMLPLDPFGLMLLQMQTFPNQHFSDLVIEFQSTIVASAISKLLPKQKKACENQKTLRSSSPLNRGKKSHRPSIAWVWLSPDPELSLSEVSPQLPMSRPHSYHRYGFCLPSFWNIFQGLPWSLGYVCFLEGTYFLCFIVYISGTPGLRMLYTVSSWFYM